MLDFQQYFVDSIDAVVYASAITPAQARSSKITADNDVHNFTVISTSSLTRGNLLVTPRPVVVRRNNLDDDSSDDQDGDEDMDGKHHPTPIDTLIGIDCFPTIAGKVGFSENFNSLLRNMRL